MFTLITGGAASGKSAFAEAYMSALPGQKIYLATLEPWDSECLARIARHRRARAHRGFVTVERYTDLAGAELPADGNVLLECMGNLVANELYSPAGGGGEAAVRGVESVLSRCAHLTVVTNEVFSGGQDYAGDTLRYLEVLARVDRALARRADRVIEVVCGLPNVLKG